MLLDGYMRKRPRMHSLSKTVFTPGQNGLHASTAFTGIDRGLEGARRRLIGLERKIANSQKRLSHDSSAGPRIATVGRPGVSAVLEIVKIEFFSDKCFYLSSARRESIADGEVEGRQEKDWQNYKALLRDAQDCIDRSELPKSCGEYRHELSKSLAFLVGKLKRRIVARSAKFFEQCLPNSGRHVGGQLSENPTPLDFELYGSEYAIPEMQGRIEEISGRIPYSLNPKTVAHLYWRDRCRRSISANDLTMTDLLVCGDRAASSDQIARFRELLGEPD